MSELLTACSTDYSIADTGRWGTLSISGSQHSMRLSHSILLREKGVSNKVDNYVFLDMIEIVKTCSN